MVRENLINLLEGKNYDELREYYINLIKKMASQKGLDVFLRNRVGDDYAEEVFSLFLLKLKIMEKTIRQKENIVQSYVNKIIYTCIIDILNSFKKGEEISVRELSHENEEGEVLDFEDAIPVYHKDYSIEAEDLLKIVMKIISEKDIEVLCYYLNKEFYSREIPISVNKTTLYKRWERLRKKLASELPYIPSEEEFRAFAEKFLSEVCEKKGFI